MDKPTVGQVICFRVTGEKRQIKCGEWAKCDDAAIFRWGDDQPSEGRYTPLEPIDPARVTIAPKPERFYCNPNSVTVRDREDADWWVETTSHRTAEAFLDKLNALDRAAKEKSNAE